MVLFFSPVILLCKRGIWKPLEKETCKVPYRMRTCLFKKMGFGEESHCFDTSATCPSFVRWLQDKTNSTFPSVKLSFASTELSNPFPAWQFVSTNPDQKWSQHWCSRGELTPCSFHTGIFAPTSLCSHWSFQSHCNLLPYCANKQSRRELPSSMVVFISHFLSCGKEREFFCTNWKWKNYVFPLKSIGWSLEWHNITGKQGRREGRKGKFYKLYPSWDMAY